MKIHQDRQTKRRVRASLFFFNFRQIAKVSKFGAAVSLLLALATPALAAETADPLEPVNRVTFKFNQMFDRVVLRPLATTYQKVTPRFAKSMIGNFFDNLGEVPNVVNDVLQLDLGQASNDLGRLAVNSTLGVGGLFEVADPMLGLEKNKQDFGQTLAHWGVEQGPYLVLPLFGPSTLRDSFNVAVNSVIHPVSETDHVATRNSLSAGRSVDLRADLLILDGLIIGDPYIYLREAYIQHREYTINGDQMMVAFEDF